VLVWGVQTLALGDSKFPVWYPYYGSWVIGLTFDIIRIVLLNLGHHPTSVFDYCSLVVQIIRICFLAILLFLYCGLRNRKSQYKNVDEESQALLQKKLAPQHGSSEETTDTSPGYGTTATTDSNDSETAKDSEPEDNETKKTREAKKRMLARLENDGSWWTYAKGFSVSSPWAAILMNMYLSSLQLFFPYIWPVHNKRLQFRAILVGACLLAKNLLNVLIPRQLGIITDSLTKHTSIVGVTGSVIGRLDHGPWTAIAIYTVLRFLRSSSCLGWLRYWLWLPLSQYAYDALSCASHAHMMNLSADFHDSKTSSELSQAISQGRSVSNLVDSVCFSIIPMLIDLGVAFTYLYWVFGPYMALLTASASIAYIYVTGKMITAIVQPRRDYVTTKRKEAVIVVQGFEGWQNASYFNRISYETSRYGTAVKKSLHELAVYNHWWQLLNFLQDSVMTTGLMAACYLAAYQVWETETRSVGDFVTLLTYWGQLEGKTKYDAFV
jgi:hypothetical protein